MIALLGLGYRARHGKDTAAKAIVDARGAQYKVGLYPFAKALKDEYTEACQQAGGAYELIQIYRVTHNLPDWVQYELGADMTDPLCPYGKQRTLLQWWGTEYRRKQDDNYWVIRTAEAIQRDNPDVAIITDVRFPNETHFVKANGGYTINVERQGYSDSLATAHTSERALASYPWDITLSIPEGQVDTLKREAVEVFDMVVGWGKQKLQLAKAA
jgi:hypothetical protein